MTQATGLFRAMQAYKEGARTFCNAITMCNFKTKEAAAKYAKRKAKGLPYVTCGAHIVWTPFHNLQDKESIANFVGKL